ncbi:MAG: DegT/DnrJ/EryC1/StrS family aminotransferase [Deltaproteobacteria bacterium]|nr:DegT/DnrJ/EryC1/StrS family aminotransferase [Deltaproteobacteria bacterium]
MTKLAIHGGEPVRYKLFPAYCTIGEEEKAAALGVLDSGVLSKFLGCWHDDFLGGPQVRALEKEWAKYFGVKHAIAVNSCTSGLYCAVGATGVEPGEEIIVSPFTMCATATAPIIFNAIPVFADIEEDYFCLDPESVEDRITHRTRAIIVVDIFGLPYDVQAINAIARKYGLLVIEDTAQAPGALCKGKYAGTLADIGVYSLNYHKHIHCGEGGIAVTNNDMLADRMRLIRNHAEGVVEEKGVSDLSNMIGFNFRMTEIEAAIARCQLQKLEGLIEARQRNCEYIAYHLSQIPAIAPCKIRDGCTHSYYVQPFKFNKDGVGVSRDTFINAVKAELPAFELREKEGVKINCGYVKPLYLLPMFQKQMAYGSKGYPFASPWYDGQINYNSGVCSVAERIHEKELFIHELMLPSLARNDLDDVVNAFGKVWDNRDVLT